MVLRKIVRIDEEKCDGCGLCIPACHEGALQIIDGKARLVSDKYCDGLGDCLQECPKGAIQIIEREAEEFDEEAVKERMKKKEESFCGCPGLKSMELQTQETEVKSKLKNWPVQIMLAPPEAPYFKDSNLLICADCVPFAYPRFHSDLMKGKTVLVGCPKLDNAQYYIEKLASIFKKNSVGDIVIARMEVPCCGGMNVIIERALQKAQKNIPVEEAVIKVHN